MNTRDKKDLKFLKQMKAYFIKANNYNDTVAREMLGCMIDDWIDELLKKKG